jgi:hypothetical protein
MGISSTGILYWGLDFGEDRPWLGEDDPYDEDDEEFDPDDCLWMANGAKKTDSYAVQRESAKDLGVEIIIHCSYDYAMYGLGVSESVRRASRGYPVKLNEVIVKPEWEVMLWIAREKLAAKFGPAWAEGDPSWILTSVYG